MKETSERKRGQGFESFTKEGSRWNLIGEGEKSGRKTEEDSSVLVCPFVLSVSGSHYSVVHTLNRLMDSVSLHVSKTFVDTMNVGHSLVGRRHLWRVVTYSTCVYHVRGLCRRSPLSLLL